jgi:hypothetical protein
MKRNLNILLAAAEIHAVFVVHSTGLFDNLHRMRKRRLLDVSMVTSGAT